MAFSSVLGASSVIKPGVCTSTTRPSVPYDGQLIYETDTDLVKAFNGTAFVTVGPAPAVAIFNETQASGTQGGASVTGSLQKRTLNTTVVNQIASCTLTSSVIALPAGTYSVLAFAPFHKSGVIKIVLRNTTDSTNQLTGINLANQPAEDITVNATIQGVFTIAATKNFELQYRCDAAQATNGLGNRCNFAGIDEVYSSIEIIKLA